MPFLLGEAAEHEKLVVTIVDKPRVSDAIVGFHAQRSVVKLIEAVLSARAIPFSHSALIDLIGLVEQNGIAAPPELAQAKTLAPWTHASLYENRDATEIDRKTIGALLAKLLMWVEEEIEAVMESPKPKHSVENQS